MNLYLFFAGTHYYPNGGAEDFVELYATEAEARRAAEASEEDWAHVALFSDGKLKIVFSTDPYHEINGGIA